MITWEVPAVLALALISAVVTLMLFRFVRRDHYLVSRPALFIGGVIFMPLFVAIAVVLRADWSDTERATGLVLLMVGFWAAAAWLASPRTQGRWVPGLEFGAGLNFRPDLILPGGVMFVKGTILTGIGIMLSVQESFRLPKWNWWGFVLAFFGIITLIPIRGMAKMLARRGRFLGRPPAWQIPVRWGLLVAGLLVLLYGFLAAFMGQTPFTEFRPVAGQGWLAAALLTAAALSLLAREVWKRRLLEGVETTRARFGSNLWLYASVVVFMYGYLLAFMGRIMRPHPADNPAGLIIGAAFFTLGASLVLVTRPGALHNELRGMIRVTVGTVGAMPPEARWKIMNDRMRTIAACPIPQRPWHIQEMTSAVGRLDPEAAAQIDQTRTEVMMSLTSRERMAMMEAMDQLVA